MHIKQQPRRYYGCGKTRATHLPEYKLAHEPTTGVVACSLRRPKHITPGITKGITAMKPATGITTVIT